MAVHFTEDPVARALIGKIASRAAGLYAKHGEDADVLGIVMDLSAAHVTCPLRLADMVEADDFNLMHDVSGINRHLDRDTGRLTGCFRPRFSAPEAADTP